MSDHRVNQTKTDAVKVTILDDHPGILEVIKTYIKGLHCNIACFTDPIECLRALEHEPTDILITDLAMPNMSGIEVLDRIKQTSPSTEVIVITGAAKKEEAIKALKLGAFDFFEKPVSKDDIQIAVRRTMQYREMVRQRDILKAQVSFLSEQNKEQSGVSNMICHAPAMRKIMNDVKLVVKSPHTSVFVVGESGTGKELIARAIHYGSARSDKPFIAVNCSAVPSDLVESTLFGHTKGAFTGAIADHKGCFERADGGTLFLDEIGDMPTEMQTKLLRVLEDMEITPIGGARKRIVNVRVVAATNACMADLIKAHTFRKDLYYRLAGFTIDLPPLRSRREEIPYLADHFLALLAQEMGMVCPQIEQAAMDKLMRYRFPGNIRELRNIIERALIESHGDTIKADNIHECRFLGDEEAEPSQSEKVPSAHTHDLPLDLKVAEGILVKKALRSSSGNVSQAAKLLGVNRAKLYRLMATHQSDAN
jgi:DNA-binding NtrC family response regulator